MRSPLAISTLAAGIMLLPNVVQAQDVPESRSILSASELRDLVAARVAEDRDDRSALDRFLARGDVRRVARDAGIELLDVRSAAASLDEDEVRRLAPRLREAEAALAGGEVVTISTTAIIIGLLILIVILVA